MRIITADQVAASLPWTALVERLATTFREGVESPPRHHHAMQRPDGEATMLLMPAWERAGYIGVKMVNVFPQNADHGIPAISGVYLLSEGAHGCLLACLDGSELTRRRTAAASALAARELARADAETLLVVGTGKLAPMVIEAQRLCLEKNALANAYLKPTVYFGAEGLGLRAKGLTVHVMVAAWDLGDYISPEAASIGLRALTSSWSRHHVNISLCRAKTNGHYVNSMLALNTAVKAGFDEALMLAVVAGTLTLAGCSYTPARVQSQPLLEIDGYSGHRHYRGDDRHYRDRYRRHHRVERHYYYDDDRRRGGFCPPGLRMQGRC